MNDRRYICSLSGQCEDDPQLDADRLTLEECQETCRASAEKELDYLTLEYALGADADLMSIAPSDRVELVRRLSGVRVESADALNALIVLTESDLLADDNMRERVVDTLLRHQSLWKYLWNVLENEAKNRLAELGTPTALLFMKDENYDIDWQTWQTYLENSQYDDETKELLFSDVKDMLWHLATYNTPEYDTPGLVALSYLTDNPQAKKWFNELTEAYREYLLENYNPTDVIGYDGATTVADRLEDWPFA